MTSPPRFRASASATITAAFTVLIPPWLAPVTAQTPGPANWGDAPGPEFAQRVDQVFEDLDTGRQPGCAVSVERPDGPLLRRGYGMADLEHAIPLTPRSAFPVGELSEELLRAAELLLEMEGHASPSDRILHETAQRRILDPLGMRATRFVQDETRTVSDRARAYRPREEGAGFRYAAHLDPRSSIVAVTSVEDLGRWIGSLLTPDPFFAGLGLGDLGSRWQGSREAHRAGHRVATLLLPDERLGIVVACNRADLDPLHRGREILEALRDVDPGPH